jgi:hypothetical protein
MVLTLTNEQAYELHTILVDYVQGLTHFGPETDRIRDLMSELEPAVRAFEDEQTEIGVNGRE